MTTVGENMVIQTINGKSKYVRYRSNESDILCNDLKNVYNSQYAILATSGLHAIVSTLTAILDNDKCNTTIVYSNELYTDTPKLINELKNKYLCMTEVFDIQTHETYLVEYAKKNSNPNNLHILFTETCSNPNGFMFNLDILHTLKHHGRWIVIVDNTWLTHVVCNPLAICSAVDFVVLSLTKYYSGGTRIGGAIITNDPNHGDNIINHMYYTGIHISPETCNRIHESMIHMESRMINASNSTKEVIDRLKLNGKIRLMSPYLVYPQMQIIPSVFTVTMPNVNKKTFVKTIAQYDIDFITSFGAEKSRICPYFKNKNGNIIFRVSIGFNDEWDRVYNILTDIINTLTTNHKK